MSETSHVLLEGWREGGGAAWFSLWEGGKSGRGKEKRMRPVCAESLPMVKHLEVGALRTIFFARNCEIVTLSYKPEMILPTASGL